jgi:hypothetical protein
MMLLRLCSSSRNIDDLTSLRLLGAGKFRTSRALPRAVRKRATRLTFADAWTLGEFRIEARNECRCFAFHRRRSLSENRSKQNTASPQSEEKSMSQLPEMVELSGAELDAVTGGQAEGVAVAAGGLVNVALGAANVDVLRAANINVDIIDDITIRNVANNNNISVGAVIQILGGGAAVITRQLQ